MTLNIYDVSVRFMRKVQVKEYEPVEAETTLKAQTVEGTEYKTALADTAALMLEAREIVLNGLKGKAAAAAGETVTETKVEPAPTKGKPGRPPKDKKADAAKGGDTDDFGESTTTKTAEPATNSAAEEDEFADVAPKADEKPMSADELQKWISGHIQSKKIAVAKVKEILLKYGAARTADTKEEDRTKIKADVEAALSK